MKTSGALTLNKIMDIFIKASEFHKNRENTIPLKIQSQTVK